MAAAALGFVLCHLLAQNATNCLWLQCVFANVFYGSQQEEDREISATFLQDENKSKQKPKKLNKINTQRDSQPWENMLLNATLNKELEEFFETLIAQYINNWYNDKISEDTAFLLEIRFLIRHSSAKIVKALWETDLDAMFTDEIVPQILLHVERICRFSEGIKPPFDESQIFNQWPDPHWAMLSPENQLNYLRTISDALVCKFVDDIRIGGCFVDEEHQQMLNREGANLLSTKWSCHSSRHFLRELLLTTVFVPTIDFISDPDCLNQLALTALNDDHALPSESSPIESGKVQFLANFTEQTYSQAPDSLMGLKLSDLVRDPYLIKLFTIYMRDLNVPTAYLDCFLQTREIHSKIHKLTNSHTITSLDHRTRREQMSNEIFSDAWQLFSTFVHSNAPNRIGLFSETMCKDFCDVVESKQGPTSLKALERVVEAVYQELYQHLQYNYVIPFCQSENYLGYTIGAPGDVDELIHGPEEFTSIHKHRIPDASFSLSQFRKKFFNLIMPSRESAPSSSNATFYSSASTSDLEGLAMSAEEILGNTPFGYVGPGSSEGENGSVSGASSIALSDMGRDLNKWTVAVEGIEDRREQTGHINYVFSLAVERKDLPEDDFASTTIKSSEVYEEKCDDQLSDRLPKRWTVIHKYDEFYALEDKLRDFYALRILPLPDRKNTLQMLRLTGRNNRALMDSHRVHFERFLHQLLQQPLLKRSDLLYLFLTCSEEDCSGVFDLPDEAIEGAIASIGNTFLPDLNPIRAVRKATAKERGQSLKPFVLNLLANILAPPRACSFPQHLQLQQRQQLSYSPSVDSREMPASKGKEDQQSISSFSMRSHQKQVQQQKPTTAKRLPSTTTHNPNPKSADEHVPEIDRLYWKRNFYEILVFMFCTLLGRIPEWMEAILCSLHSFIGYIVFMVFHRKTKCLTQPDFLTSTAIKFVRALHEHIRFLNDPGPSLSATPSQISVASSTSAPMQINTLRNKRKTSAATSARNNSAQPKAIVISEQERQLRAQLLLRCLEKRAEEFPGSKLLNLLLKCSGNNNNQEERNGTETAVHQLFHCFQSPLLNRQLAFVLMDILVQRVFIEPK